MKRIAAHIGLTVFCALAAAFYLPQIVTIYAAGIAGVSALLLLCFKKTRRKIAVPVTLIVIALSFCANLIYTAVAVKPITDRFCGEDQKIEATLTDEVYRQYSKCCYRLTTDTINGEEVHTKILLKTNHTLDIEPFDHISFTADITPTQQNHYRAKGYFITVNALDMDYQTTASDEKPLYYHVIGLRRAMRDAIDRCLPEEEADLCKAILIGDKYALDEEVKEDFRYSGASYFVVVSGMHFSILCWMSLWLFSRVFRKQWLYFPLTYLVIFLYMMITGFQPSVMRSGVMMLILTTGRWMLRMTDPLTSLGIAGACMPFIFSPYGCGDIGLILSFAATFSIIVWQPPIYRKIHIRKKTDSFILKLLIKGVNAVLTVLSVSLAANILVLPLSVFLFNGFSVMTLVSSLLLYPLIPLIMGASLFVCVLFYLGPLRYAAVLLAWPLYGLTKLTLWIVKTLASFSFAYIHINALYFYIWTAVTLSLGIAAYLLRRRYRLYPYVALLSAIVLTGGLMVHCIISLNTNYLEYYAGKDGAAVCLNYCGRIHMLRFDCDSSSAYKVLYRIEDDYGGAQSAICTTYSESLNYDRLSERELPITHYLKYQKVTRVAWEHKTDEVLSGSATITLDDGVILRTVENNGKLLLYLTDSKKAIMLIPSGFDFDAIPASMRYADVIVIDRSAEKYDDLSCEELFLTSSEKQKNKLPHHDNLYKPEDKYIRIDLN